MITRLCNIRLWLGALSLIIAGLAFAQSPGTSGSPAVKSQPAAAAPGDASGAIAVPSDHDLAFVREASLAGMLEIRLSSIAALRANSDRVRQFARSVVEDHSKARRKLKEIALSKDLEFGDELDRKRALLLLAVQRYTGDEFDREYLTQQVDQHRRVVRLFQEQAQKGGDDELRDFAGSKLPALEALLKLARTLADSR